MKNILRWTAAFGILLPLAGAAPAASSSGAGTSVAVFLSEERGARISAYGGAGAAIGGDLFAAQVNPASLATMDRYAAAFERDNIVLDIAASHASVGGPIFDRLSWALSYTGISYGKTLRTSVSDPTGTAGGTFDGSDRAVSVALATRFGPHESISVGGAVKPFRFEIAGYDATGVAYDAGIQWAVTGWSGRPSGLRIGASVVNAGSDVTFVRDAEPLPTRWRLGGLWRHNLSFGDYEIALDGVGGNGEAAHVRAGGGLRFYDFFSLRGGYDGGAELESGLSAGLGIEWKDLSLDYAYRSNGDFGSQNRLSLEYSFARPGGDTRREEPVRVAAAPSRPAAPIVAAVRPAPSVRADALLFLEPPGSMNDPVWEEALRFLTDLPGVRLARIEECEARLDLILIRREPDGRWGGTAVLRAREGRIIDTQELVPPTDSPEDAAARAVAWAVPRIYRERGGLR